MPFCFPLFLWDPYNSNISTFTIVPVISEAILNSFNSFSFILLFSSYFHYFIFQLTYLFCLSYFAIASFQSIYFSNCVIHLCLFFISSVFLVIVLSLLVFSCIFSILFLSLWNIFTIIILNSLSCRLLISFLFIWSYEFLSFICAVFLCLLFFFFFFLTHSV